MLLHDHGHGHSHHDEEGKRALAKYIWHQETVELTTVGIDIGSSTSHLLIARIRLQRRSQGLSSRFEVTDRKVLYRSPIMLTPFLAEGTIDVGSLKAFIASAYGSAGFERSDIDSGAVILTGEAIKRKNARSIDELFAEEAGKFVCATAGHKLECTLAAHGSGAVKLSQATQQRLLHCDIGGGTTKLALIDSGQILGVGAFAVGGRLIAQDDLGEWTRVDESAQLVADDLGLKLDSASLAKTEVRHQIAKRLAEILADYILGGPRDRLGKLLQLTETITTDRAPDAISFSGGVSEYLLRAEKEDFGDIAGMLANQFRKQLDKRIKLPVCDPGQGIRATVIGASQFTVQVSGKTIYLPEETILPIHNVPVIHIEPDLSGTVDSNSVTDAIRAGLSRMDLAPGSRIAVAFSWAGEPEYERIRAVAKGIVAAVDNQHGRQEPLLLMIDGDIGKTIGNILARELGLSGNLLSVDGVHLQELDFVDVGEVIEPPGVVPIVIKSLLFS